MMNALRSEFRKLFTIRSTYILSAAIIALTTLFAFFIFGYKTVALAPSSPQFVVTTMQATLGFLATFGAIIAILSVAHEYRYNTILYTLTFNRSRLTVLAAKTVVVLGYIAAMTLIVTALTYIGLKLGLSMADKTLVPQNFPLLEMLWKYILYTCFYGLLGIILAFIIRGLVGAIVSFFLLTFLESAFVPLLKENAKYLPIRSLDAIPTVPSTEVSIFSAQTAGSFTSNQSIGVVSLYLLVFGALAIVLFLKRDATE